MEQKPVTLEDFSKWKDSNRRYTKKQMKNFYNKYVAEVNKENKCGRETGHINQKGNGLAGCYICSDCGAWYV